MKILLLPGTRYRAELRLSWSESFAGNSTIREKLVEAGFTNVTVSGDGRSRRAEGTWAGGEEDVVLPEQIANVEAIP